MEGRGIYRDKPTLPLRLRIELGVANTLGEE